eukprot:TRINITY_DN8151_c0_g1_i1.p1 TRINITY_DN8151_c0_g1~~TRINITY_DN8151_c0_g1_i1.p1  ORF type:complete len:116 (-),score=45.10 TRINITY_DN8151_c0_g1_i1:31-378(-)
MCIRDSINAEYGGEKKRKLEKETNLTIREKLKHHLEWEEECVSTWLSDLISLFGEERTEGESNNTERKINEQSGSHSVERENNRRQMVIQLGTEIIKVHPSKSMSNYLSRLKMTK